jgi:glycosyltransferase involved in cell wall biosynthesis
VSAPPLMSPAFTARPPLQVAETSGSIYDTIKLSILMPAFNEERTIAGAVTAILKTEFPCEIELIVVDDGSTDDTLEILRHLSPDELRVTIVAHHANLGKGAAIQTAAALARGTHLVPFDADLEYDPYDLVAMVDAVARGRGDVIYGTRMFGTNTRFQSYRHAVGNRALTLLASVMFDAYLSDMHTCLKLIPADWFRRLSLAESGFGLDTEITAKMLRAGQRPFEVPVTYCSRSAADGKKITWRDGVKCLQILVRVRFEGRQAVTRAGLPAVDADTSILAGGGGSCDAPAAPHLIRRHVSGPFGGAAAHDDERAVRVRP